MLGDMRSRQMVSLGWDVVKCDVIDGKIFLTIMMELHSDSADVLLYPSFLMFRLKDGSQVLPLLDLNKTDVVLLPGTSQSRILESTAPVMKGEALSIQLISWNGRNEARLFSC